MRPEVVEALPLPGAGRMQPLLLAALAVLGLVSVVGALETANFVAAQFAQASWLGWLTLALVGPLAGLLGWSLLREWRGYSQIETVEGLRRRLAAAEPSLLYPGGQELADFGAPQTALSVRIAQISAVVGRGAERFATVPVL